MRPASWLWMTSPLSGISWCARSGWRDTTWWRSDGEAGLIAARNAELPYDLVVTNSYMPSLSGEELIGQLRNLYPGLPILHLQDLAHPIGPNASSVATLYQPFSIDALLEAVARCLEERIRRAEA